MDVNKKKSHQNLITIFCVTHRRQTQSASSNSLRSTWNREAPDDRRISLWEYIPSRLGRQLIGAKLRVIACFVSSERILGCRERLGDLRVNEGKLKLKELRGCFVMAVALILIDIPLFKGRQRWGFHLPWLLTLLLAREAGSNSWSHENEVACRAFLLLFVCVHF